MTPLLDISSKIVSNGENLGSVAGRKSSHHNLIWVSPMCLFLPVSQRDVPYTERIGSRPESNQTLKKENGSLPGLATVESEYAKPHKIKKSGQVTFPLNTRSSQVGFGSFQLPYSDGTISH